MKALRTPTGQALLALVCLGMMAGVAPAHADDVAVPVGVTAGGVVVYVLVKGVAH